MSFRRVEPRRVLWSPREFATFKGTTTWNTKTGESIALNDTLKEQSERARRLVELSKKVLDYNLMSDYPGQKYVLEKEGLDMDLSEFIGK